VIDTNTHRRKEVFYGRGCFSYVRSRLTIIDGNLLGAQTGRTRRLEISNLYLSGQSGDYAIRTIWCALVTPGGQRHVDALGFVSTSCQAHS